MTGASSFTTDAADQTIALSTPANALTGEVTLNTTGAAGNASLTDGVALTVNGAVGGLATLNAPAIQFDTFAAGSLLATATTGGISQTDGVLTVTGILSLTDTTANQTILLNTATNALGGAITLTTAGTTGDVNIKNSGGTTLAASTVNGKLTVEDTTGGIAQTGALTVTGASSFTTDAADQTIALSTPANALTGEVTLNTTGAAGNASLTDGVALTVNGAVGGLATLNAPAIQFDTFTAGSLLATATTGGISQTDGVLTVTGISSLTDTTANQTILLNTLTNALTGEVTLSTTGAAGNASLTDGVALTVNGAVGGLATLNAPSIQFDTFTAGSLLATATTGGISQTDGVLTVTGISSLTDTTANQTILLNTATNALGGAITLSTAGAAGKASLTNGIATVLGASTVRGALSVTSDGAITQAAATSVTAAGTALSAVGFPITLASAGNDFDTTAGTFLTATGAAITITDQNALQLGNVTATGLLSVTAGTGPITQTAASVVTAAGTSLVSGVAPNPAGDIALANAGNDFDTAAGTFLTASGAAITVADKNALQLGNVSATGTFSVTAGGALTQIAPIKAQNLVAVTLLDTEAPITLDNLGNAVPGNVRLSALNTAGVAPAPGAISFIDSTGFTVAGLAAPSPQRGVVNQGQNIVLASTLAGGRITNAGAIDSTGGVAASSDILILADLMTLNGGTINAGAAGRVVLGPHTSRGITLGGTAANTLSLTYLDLATITAGLLQIGAESATYSNETITVTGAITSPAPVLSLVSAGDITDGTPPNPAEAIAVTNLALQAGGSVHLKGAANNVALLAGIAGGNFAFADGAANLTVAKVPPAIPPALATVQIAAGVPSVANALALQIAGVAANSVSLRNTGDLTIADPVNAATTVAMQDGGKLTINAAVSGGAGNGAQFLTDTIVIAAPVNFPGGVVLIAPNDPTRGIDLAAVAPPANVLEITNADLAKIFAAPGGTIQLGYFTGFTGPITVSGAATLNPANAPTLALVTGSPDTAAPGAISEAAAGTIAARNLALWAAGSDSMPNDNVVTGALAGRAGTSPAGSFLFHNAAPLNIGTVNNLVANGGPDAVDPNIAGIATQGGTIILETTGAAGNLTLSQTVNANGFDPTTLTPIVPLAANPGQIGLSSVGAITQNGAGLIVGSQLEALAVNSVSLGLANRLGANDVGGVAQTAGVVAGRVTTAGQSFGFRDDEASLTVGTVAVTDGGISLAAQSGVVSAGGLGGDIVLETTNSGGLALGGQGNILLTQPVNANNGSVTLAANPGQIGLSSVGAITQNGAGLIVGSQLEALAVNSVSLGLANRLGANDVGGVAQTAGVVAGQVTTAGQSFGFRDDEASLTVGTVAVTGGGSSLAAQSGVETNNGNAMLQTTTTGNVSLNRPVNLGTGTLTVISAGTIAEAGAGTISALTLIGSSVGDANFGLPGNLIVNLGAFTTTTGGANGNFTLVDAGPLSITGPVNTGSGIVSLTVAGAVAEAAGGTVTAGTLTGSSAGDANFGLPGNLIANLGAFATTTGGANGNFTLVDAQALAITGSVNTGTGTVSLTVAGGITEAAGGTVTAGTLTGSAAGDATFAQPGNLVANLGAFAANNFTLVDGEALNIAGPVNVGAGTVSLTVAGTISEGAGGSVTAGLLTGNSVGNAIFGQPANLVTNLGAFSTAGSNFTLADGRALNLTGLLNLGGGAASLNAAGTITEQPGGSILAGTLTGSSVGNATFDQANAIGNLAAFTARSGGVFALTDNQALNVSGPVASGGDLRIRVNGGDLTLSGSVSAGSGNANAALISMNGNAVEQGNGVVTAAGLIVNAAGNVSFGIVGGTVFPANVNNIATLAGKAGNSFGFLNGPGMTVGTVPQVVDVPSQTGVQAGGDVLIQTNNAGQPLTLSGNVAAGGRVVFDSAGPFRQTGVVTVDAPVLVIDTTADGVAAVLNIVNSTNVDATIVAQFPTATTTNAIQLDNLIAPNAVTFLVAGLGPVSGQLQVKQLGVSGLQPGNANLTGSVGGIGGPGAGATAVPSPRPQNQYLLNNCVIGSPNCILLPPVVPVQPQPVNDVDVSTLFRHAFAGSPQSEDPDAPLINVYDEERLCNPRPDAPPEEREFCQ